MAEFQAQLFTDKSTGSVLRLDIQAKKNGRYTYTVDGGPTVTVKVQVDPTNQIEAGRDDSTNQITATGDLTNQIAAGEELTNQSGAVNYEPVLLEGHVEIEDDERFTRSIEESGEWSRNSQMVYHRESFSATSQS